MTERMTVKKALELVTTSDDGLYGVLLENGSMELGFYKPLGADTQEPHLQDEIYIVQTGSGSFICDDKHIEFEPGDSLFVAAGVEHRFVDFSPDFAAWVIFYGPEGGES
jgi:mannose-6-phosphate isomerase-like protein (cupin superfamily)